MVERLVYNHFVASRPFCVVQENGERKVYNQEELKALGEKYDEAAKIAILEYRMVEIS